MGLGLWGLVALAGSLHGHHLSATQERHGASHHGGMCCQKYFISPLKRAMCLSTTGNGPHHSCLLTGRGPVGMPCASPKCHPGLCREEGGPFSRQCLAGLASENEGRPGADVEVVGRVNLGRKCSGSMYVRMLPAERRVGYSRVPRDVKSISVLAWAQHCGDMEILLASPYGLILSTVQLSHLPFFSLSD